MRCAQLSLMIGFGLCVALVGGECGSAIEVLEQRKGAEVRITAKNVSSSPLLAYVLAGDEKSRDGSRTTVYSGVFSGRDALAPGQSVEVAVRQGAPRPLNLLVDYVRLADSTSCGNTVTEAAKKVAARFQK